MADVLFTLARTEVNNQTFDSGPHTLSGVDYSHVLIELTIHSMHPQGEIRCWLEYEKDDGTTGRQQVTVFSDVGDHVMSLWTKHDGNVDYTGHVEIVRRVELSGQITAYLDGESVE